MDLPVYPAGPTIVQPRPEGVNVRDARRIRRGHIEIDRTVLWSSIMRRMHGSMVSEALHYKLGKARGQRRQSRRRSGHSRDSEPRSASSNVLPEGEQPKRRRKVDWWCCGCGSCKMKDQPADLAFIAYPKLPMQPDIPATKMQKLFGFIAAVIGSLLFAISIAIAKILIYGYKNSVEVVLFYQFMGILLSSIPPFLFYRYISRRRLKIWGRLIGDEQYINYKRGAMCSVRGLCGIVALVAEYYAMYFMIPPDASAVILTAPVIGAVGAMIFKKRKKDYFLMLVALLPPVGIGLIALEINAKEHLYMSEHRNIGILLPLLAMTAVALNHYILRFLRYVHWSITQFLFGLTGFLMGSIFLICNRGSIIVPIGNEIDWFGALCITSVLGEFLWHISHKYQSISTIGAIRFVLEVSILYVIEFYFHNWTPKFIVSVGVALAAAGVLAWGLKECLVFKDGRKRKRFPRCLTAVKSELNIDSEHSEHS